jgi:putative ABC transport system ATP-binding protein
MLIVEDLRKSYAAAQEGGAALQVLRGVNLRVRAGEAVALMGESGSGKSTLLHLVAGLERPDGGHVRVDGDDLHARGDAGLARWRREGIGLVFQQYNLIGSLDVRANLAFQARLAGRYDAAWAAYLAERLGLDPMLGRYPEQISGGQQQRLAIARALAGRPGLVLADEPTGSLDEGSSDTVLELLLQLVRESGSGLLMATHSARLADRLDRCVVLHHGLVQPRDAAGASGGGLRAADPAASVRTGCGGQE